MSAPSPGSAFHDWRDIKRGTRTNFLGTLARTLRVVYIVFVARIFGGEVLGYYLLAWGAVDVAAKVGLFAMDRGVIRFVSSKMSVSARERSRGIASALAVTLTLGTLTSIVLYALAAPVAERLLDQPGILPALRIMCWAIIPLAFSTVLLALTRIERHMEYEVWVRSMVEPGLLLGLSLLFYMMGRGSRGLYEAQLLSTLLGCALAAVFAYRLDPSCWALVLRRLFNPGFWRHNALLKRLLSFSFPIALSDLLAMSVMRLDLFFLAPWVSATELGTYGAAVQVAVVIRKVRQSFETIYAPVLSDQLRRGHTETVRDNLRKVTGWITVFDLGFLLVVACFGRELLSLFGKGFQSGALPLLLLTWGYAVNGFWGITETLIVLRRPYWNLYNWVVAISLGGIFCRLFIPPLGALGAALAVALLFTALNLLRLWQTHRLVKVHPFSPETLWTMLAALGLGVLALALESLGSGRPVFHVAVTAVTLFFFARLAKHILSRQGKGLVVNPFRAE